MIGLLLRALTEVRAVLQRRVLGVSADEIRYTFEDVRAEVRATRAELLEEIARLREDVDKLAARSGEPSPERKPMAHA